MQAALSDVNNAVQAAKPDLQHPPDQNRLQHAYDDLQKAVNSGDTDQANNSLDDFDSTVNDLHDNGALPDSDYNSISDASSQLRQALDG